MSGFSWLLDSPLVYRLGSGLVHFLWQGAIVATVLGVVLWLLRQRSAEVRYIVSWIALVVMAACVPVTVWVTDVPARIPDIASNVKTVAPSEQGGILFSQRTRMSPFPATTNVMWEHGTLRNGMRQ